MEKKWHVLSYEDIEKELNTSLSSGLSPREARERLAAEKKADGGERASLFVPKKSSAVQSVLSLFMIPGALALTVVSAAAVIYGGSFEIFLVLCLMLMGTLSGGVIFFIYQKRSERIREYASPTVRVKRGGRVYHTDGKNVVHGDIILLSKGDILTCDARLISSKGLCVKELISTRRGIKNRTLQKEHEAYYSSDDDVSAPNAENMLYAGSAVLWGEAEAVAVLTGAEVYLYDSDGDGVIAGNDDRSKSIGLLGDITVKTAFIGIGAIALLIPLCILTLGPESLLPYFLMLLISVTLISSELLLILHKCIFSSSIDRLAGRKNKKHDLSAYIRDQKTLETLSNVTDIVFLGTAAYTDGLYRTSNAFLADGVIKELDPCGDSERKLSRDIYYYFKALDESGIKSDMALDGISDAILSDLRSKGFDKKGADLVISSLYFAPDETKTNGYACVETAESEYRIMVTCDMSVLSYCRELDKNLMGKIEDFRANTEASCGKCLFVISENLGIASFEGAVAVKVGQAADLDEALSGLHEMGIKVTAMLPEGYEAYVSYERLKDLFGEKIIFSHEADGNTDISELSAKYSVYIGFEHEQYAELTESMRQGGAVVAAYGIDDKYYDAMARANIAISSDTIDHASRRHSESMYERLPYSGRDTNLRCSQLTRMLSRVIVRRANSRGGGVHSVENAVRRSREAEISFHLAVYFIVCMMCTALPLVLMQSVLGVRLLNAPQTVSIVLFTLIFALVAFSNIEPRRELPKSRKTKSCIDLIIQNKISLIVRLSANAAFAAAVKLLDVFGVFGSSPEYTMAVFVSSLILSAWEIFMFNKNFTRKGNGRKHTWMTFLVLYSIILLTSAFMTQNMFNNDMFPNGIGAYEFILILAHCAILTVSQAVTEVFLKKGKKH